jgi:hypothetical protein
MHDKRLALKLLDLRDEAQFNRFHLRDAERFEVATWQAVAMPQRSVKVVIGDDEGAVLNAYRELMAHHVENVDVLARGMPAWFELFGGPRAPAVSLALGANHPESRPPELAPTAVAGYIAKVERPGLGGKKVGGGCGG